MNVEMQVEVKQYETSDSESYLLKSSCLLGHGCTYKLAGYDPLYFRARLTFKYRGNT